MTDIKNWIMDYTLPSIVSLSNRDLVDRYLISPSLPTIFVVYGKDDRQH